LRHGGDRRARDPCLRLRPGTTAKCFLTLHPACPDAATSRSRDRVRDGLTTDRETTGSGDRSSNFQLVLCGRRRSHMFLCGSGRQS
jgi:hypothetical protein